MTLRPVARHALAAGMSRGELSAALANCPGPPALSDIGPGFRSPARSDIRALSGYRIERIDIAPADRYRGSISPPSIPGSLYRSRGSPGSMYIAAFAFFIVLGHRSRMVLFVWARRPKTQFVFARASMTMTYQVPGWLADALGWLGSQGATLSGVADGLLHALSRPSRGV
jgi:hypothetical protein